MTIDPNDPGTLDLDLGPTLTVEGWGTGSVTELAHYLHQLKDERDAARAEAQRAERALYEADTSDGRELVAVIARIADRTAFEVAERIAERVAERVAEQTVERVADEATERAVEDFFEGRGADLVERLAVEAVEEAIGQVRDDVRNALHDAAVSI